MATGWNTFPIEFRGGLRSDLGVLPQGLNNPGSATLLVNFEPAKEGGYRRIQGFQKFSETEVSGTGPILGLAVVDQTKTFVARENLTGDLEYYYGSGGAWTSLGSVSLVPNRVCYTRFKFGTDEKFFFTDGFNYPVIVNNTANSLTELSSVTDLLGANHATMFKQHIFVSVDNLLYFSTPYDESDWTPANGSGVINVGNDITGLIVFRDELFIFCRERIHRLSGSSLANFVLSPVADKIGCIEGATIQEVGGDIAFLAVDGIRLLSATDRNNDFGLDILSDKIPREFKSFSLTTTRYTSLTIRAKSQYRIFGYTSSSKTESAEGLLFTKFSDQGSSSVDWGTLVGINIYVADSAYTALSERTIFGNGTGFVYSLETGNSFDGMDIEAIYRSPNIPIDDPKVRKTLYRVVVYTDTTGSISFTFNMGFDVPSVTNYNKVVAPAINLAYSQGGSFVYGDITAVYGTAVYGAPLDTVFESPVIGSGKTFYFEIRDQSTNPPFSIDTAVFDYKSHDRQ